MSGRFEGQVAIVTGASYGLGHAIVSAFLEEGASVLLTDIDDRLAPAAAALKAKGFPAAAVSLDVRDRSSFARGVETAMKEFGKLDILVNNAGYSRPAYSVLDMDADEWELSMQINLRGALYGIQEAGAAMKRAGNGGRIVNIASTAAFRPYRQKSAYCVSKSGVVALTRAAALELAADRITVNAVAPGQTDTETTRALQNDPNYGEGMRKRAAAIPLGVGRPADISNAVLFFASPQSAQITGQTMIVDGGTLLQ